MPANVVQISLTRSLRAFIAGKVRSGEFTAPEECVSSILEDARRREEQSRLESTLLEGLNSGPGVVMDDAWLRQKKERLLAKHPELRDEIS